MPNNKRDIPVVVSQSYARYWLFASLPLLLFALYAAFYFFQKKEVSVASASEDALTPATITEAVFPLLCKNFTAVLGHWMNASVFLLGEHHDYSMETMTCLLSLIHDRKSREIAAVKNYSVFFEGQAVATKKAFFERIRSFDYLTPEGESYKAICEAVDACGSWDDKTGYENTKVIFEKSIQAFVLSEIFTKMQRESFSDGKVLGILQAMLKADFSLNSYANEMVVRIRKNTIQGVIKKYKEAKSAGTKHIIRGLLSAETQAIQQQFSPHCDLVSLEKLPHCLQEVALAGDAYQERNNRFLKIIQTAKKKNCTITFFRAGNSHVNAVVAMLEKKQQMSGVVVLQKK